MYTNYKKPSAWICTNDQNLQNRGRTKVYQPGSKIYLNDKEEFEIELFNPSNYNVKAEISIDGKKISSGGLVIRSGQRVYLECFPDTQKKFTFKTYEVENSQEAIEAISNNGKVEIKFYREKVNYNNPYMQPISNSFSNYRGIGSSSTGSLFSTTNVSLDSIDTGQTEGGNDSNQTFEYVNMNFDTWVLSSFNFQLLPISQKPVEPKSFKTNKKKKNSNKVDELIKLTELLENNFIDQEEFNKLKAEII
jgi:hypothetical protein